MAGTIYVVGLGAGDWKELTLGAYEILIGGLPVILRTGRHPTVSYLQEKNIQFETLDYIYEQEACFDHVYRKIVDTLLQRATQAESIVYAVPGHPWVGETTVRLLAAETGIHQLAMVVISGTSFLDSMLTALEIDPADGLLILDAVRLLPDHLNPADVTIIMQIYDRLIASRVKLTLQEVYPDDTFVSIVKSAGITGSQCIISVPLYELDHQEHFDHLTSIYLPAVTPGIDRADTQMSRLIQIMETLRGDGGCPWDKEQTHETLKPYLIEEAYEVIEAIDSKDPARLADELGDVLLQIVFHAQIGYEFGTFSMDDVVRSIVEKMIRRHPHVFADLQVKNSAQVLSNWDRIKSEEGGQKIRLSLLDGVPKHFPALMKAYKLQAKAAKVGFDWDTIDGAIEKVSEEIAEFMEAKGQASKNKMAEEVGDLLFALVNVARFADIEPETALLQTCEKFKRRFAYIEKMAAQAGSKLTDMTLEEMDRWWNEAKHQGE
jgi:tetrapyrrole methylase family protein/MazG family protein